MKVSHKSSNGRIEIFAEGETQKDVFRQLSALQEVFEEQKCGVCQGEDLRFVVRTVEDNDFYELHCQTTHFDINPPHTARQCRAKLAFGQHKGKEGTLFPKRKDAEGKYLPNNGWSVWTPKAQS